MVPPMGRLPGAVALALGLVTGLVTGLATGSIAPAHASLPDGSLDDADLEHVRTTRVDDRLQELVFRTPAVAGPTRVRVVLPAGYDDHPDRRYPVLYLLHGGLGGYRDWVDQGDADTITADHPVIVVMPDSGTGGGYLDWWNGGAGGPPMWETYHIGQLVPWIDDHYRTVGTRDGRAVAGLSMGGGGAMHYASRHPDLFTAAAAFSGAVDTNTLPVQLLVHTTGLEEGQFAAASGPRLTEEVRWRGHNPVDLAGNLEGLFLQLDTGNGLPGGPGGDTGDPVEAACWQMMTNLHDRLATLGYPHVWNDYGAGGHTWFYWKRDLRQFLPRLMDRFAAPAPPPEPFRYRTIDPVYEVWGWRVEIDRPAAEFSALRGASADGFRLTGSGSATVTSAALYEPGARLTLRVADHAGVREQEVTVDETGVLAVDVSLGPGNPEQQYSPAGTVWALTAGARPGTWPSVTATVRIQPAPQATPGPAGSAAPTARAVPTGGSAGALPATGHGATPALLAALAIAATATALGRAARRAA